MRFLIIVTLVLAGCSEPESAKLERQFEILEKADRGDKVLCEKGNEVADAHLREEDAENYRKWSVYASTHCTAVAVDHLRLVR